MANDGPLDDTVTIRPELGVLSSGTTNATRSPVMVS
jgi:hypothetical protein